MHSTDAATPPHGTRSAGSRRARRAAEEARAAALRAQQPHPLRWLPRAGVIAALAGITVVLPLTGQVVPGNGTFVAGATAETRDDAPSTIDALAAVPISRGVPVSIAYGTDMGRDATIAASRSIGDARSLLPGCDPDVKTTGSNGKLDTGDLCTLWGSSNEKLRGDAATALAELNVAYKNNFGSNLCVTDGYRTYADQVRLKRTRGGFAATPGTSNHGWGLAVDLCRIETSGTRWTWLNENAPLFGWINPDWAKPGGSGPYERWHWEYERGVREDGSYYSQSGNTRG